MSTGSSAIVASSTARKLAASASSRRSWSWQRTARTAHSSLATPTSMSASIARPASMSASICSSGVGSLTVAGQRSVTSARRARGRCREVIPTRGHERFDGLSERGYRCVAAPPTNPDLAKEHGAVTALNVVGCDLDGYLGPDDGLGMEPTTERRDCGTSGEVGHPRVTARLAALGRVPPAPRRRSHRRAPHGLHTMRGAIRGFCRSLPRPSIARWRTGGRSRADGSERPRGARATFRRGAPRTSHRYRRPSPLRRGRTCRQTPRADATSFARRRRAARRSNRAPSAATSGDRLGNPRRAAGGGHRVVARRS